MRSAKNTIRSEEHLTRGRDDRNPDRGDDHGYHHGIYLCALVFTPAEPGVMKAGINPWQIWNMLEKWPRKEVDLFLIGGD